MPQKIEYLHRKSRCEMLMGGDDISNDVIILGTCFSMFVYIRARFRFALIGGNLTAQSMGSPRGIGGGIQIPERERRSCKLSFLFLPAARVPRRACSQARLVLATSTSKTYWALNLMTSQVVLESWIVTGFLGVWIGKVNNLKTSTYIFHLKETQSRAQHYGHRLHQMSHCPSLR